MAIINGTSANNTLKGTTADDELYGLGGNDILIGGAGADKLDGGDGTDTASYANATAIVVASLANSAANIGEAAGDTYIDIENLTGSKFNDTLVGDGADNTLDGGAGDDTLIGGAGADQLIGGANSAGGDTANYSTSVLAVTVNLLQQGTGFKNGVITGPVATFKAQEGGDAEGDKLFGIENVVGSAENDVITGDAKNNVIEGGAGADELDGGNGTDTLSYASSAAGVNIVLQDGLNVKATVSGGDAAGDTAINFENLIGSAAADILEGNGAANTIKGGDEDDLIRGNDGNDILYGEAGDDTIFGGAGKDVMDGGDGFDILNYELLTENITLALGHKQTTVSSNTKGAESAGDKIAGFEQVVTGSGADKITGSAGDDTIYAGDGNDWVDGGAGADTLVGDDGIDTVSYASGKTGVTIDLVNESGLGGDAEGDTVTGFENVIGTGLGDVLIGNAADNTLDGGAGDDVLAGRGGADQLIGGANSTGGDTADYSASGAAVTVNLLQQGTGFKNGVITGPAATFKAQEGGDADGDTLFGIENVIGSADADIITGDAKNNVIEGGAGADTLDGGNGIDTLSYASSSVGVDVALQDGLNVAAVVSGGDAAGDDAKNFENITGSGSDDVLTGNAAANVLIGGAGEDFLIGLGGTDTLVGGDDDDMLIGGAGADKLAGGDGIDTVDYLASLVAVTIDLTKQGIFDPVKNAITKATAQKGGDAAGDLLSGIENVIGSTLDDVIIASADANKFLGHLGKDTVSYAASAAAVSANLDTAEGKGGYAEGDEYDGIENLTGSKFDDTLTGDDDDNTLDGGAGDDTLIGGLGADQLIGGANGTGGDTADYSASAAAVTVNLLQQGTGFKNGVITGPAAFKAQEGGDADDDTLFGIENVIGSSGADIITGDSKNNVIEGGAGADILDGGAGIDTVSYAGSNAALTLYLNGADVALNIGGGHADGGEEIKNFENVIGTGFEDELGGDAGNNVLDGRGGNDYINGFIGNDTLLGGDGDDELDGSLGTDTLFGGADNDKLSGGAGADKIAGGDGIDTADYSQSAAGVTIDLTKQGVFDAVKNTISKATAQKGGDAAGDLLSGIENVIGSDHNDIFVSNNDSNKFEGGLGKDTVSYAASNSAITANLANAAANGGGEMASGDTYFSIENLTGSKANDSLVGDSGDNTLDGGAGDDVLSGGAGADQLIGGANNIKGGEFGDAVNYADSGAAVTIDLNTQGTGFDAKTGLITGKGAFGAQKGGDAEGDTLFGIENVIGSAFDDIVTGDKAINFLNGGSGDDVIDGGAGNDVLSGGSGDDLLIGGAGADTIIGGGHTDTVSYAGSKAAVTVKLGLNDDEGPLGIGGDAAGDKISGVENIIGSAFNDKLTGGDQDNTLTGGLGNDLLEGGAGADTFVHGVGHGIDTIVDFEDGVDFMDLTAFDGLQFADLKIQQEGANTVVSMGGGSIKLFQLNDFTSTDIDASDFKFANASPDDIALDNDTIDENNAPDTLIGTLSATDPDDVSGFTFELTDDADGRFELKNGNEIYAVDPLNAEDASSINIKVKVTDAKGAFYEETLTINVNDENEFTPVFTSPFAFDVNENTTGVATITGEDDDITDTDLIYLITGGDDADLFTIDLNTGALSFKAAPDFENPGDKDADNVYDIDITISDGDLAETKTIAVTVKDADEFAPEITSDGGGADAVASIDENTTAVTTVVATDADAAAEIVYSISGGLDGALFTIDEDTGVLTFKSAPDFEDPADADFDNVYEVEVTATSGAKSDTQTIKVTVGDAEEAPEFATGNFTVGENTVEIGTVVALDPDGTGTVTYSIDGGDDAGAFAIDANTGVLSFVGNPDFENPADLFDADNVYEVRVRASDGTSSQTQDVTVTVTDVNEAPTKIELDTPAVDEMAAKGTVVGTLSTTDPDAADANQNVFTYTLVDDAGGLFALVGDQIVVNGDIDWETTPNLSIQVQAKDSAGNVFGQSIDITVNDLDELAAPDGYIAGATIFADKDGDFELDGGEASVTSDAFGNFNFASGANPVVLTGGTDIATGKAFAGYMSAHAGATVVSPLTTLVHHLHLQFGGDYNETTANAAVLNALGLNVGIGNLKNYDQIAATIAGDPNAPDAAKAATRLQEFLAMAIPLFVALGSTNADAQYFLLREINEDIQTSTPLTFSAAQIEGYINDASAFLEAVDPDVAEDVAEVIAQILAAMDALASDGTELLEELAEIAIVASNAAAAIGAAATGTVQDMQDVRDLYTDAALAGLINDEDGNSQDVAGINGDNELTGTAGADFLDGGAGDDKLDGGDGNDTLVGGEGNDELYGGGGKDVLIGGPGDDLIDGGQWFTAYDNEGSGDLDRVSYANAPSAVTVNLSIKGTPQNTGGAGTDSIIHVEGIIGSAFDDELTGGGNDFIETFRGGDGNDTIDGGGSGLDRAEYGDGIAGVTIDLGAGKVEGTTAGLGDDTLIGIEEIFGTAFDDIYDASGFTASTDENASDNAGDYAGTYNAFHGGDGDDIIIGNGDTRIDYVNATHGVTVDLTNRDVDANTGKVYGGEGVGTDTFSGVNRVRGSAFDDLLIGGQQEYGAPGKAEVFMGMGGDDRIYGGSGYDYAQYNVAAFVLDGITASAGNTAQSDYWGNTYGIIVNMADGKVYGDTKSFGTDTLREVEGIFGSVLADLYDATGYGADSANKLSQGIVIDEFEGGAGDDVIIGSGGTRVSYRNATSGVTVDLSVNNDGSGTVTGDDSVGTDILVGGVSSIRGSDFIDVLTGWDNLTPGSIQTFDGQGGNDIIDGNGGFDRVTYNQDNEVTKGITITITANGQVAHVANSTGLTATVTGNTLEVGDDTLSDIEWYTATNFDDTITILGKNAPTNFGTIELEGAGGDDIITGLLAQGTITRIGYIGATDGVTVTFSGVGSGTAVGDESVGTDTFSKIRDVRGGLYDDVITGYYEDNSDGLMNNVFQGGAGGNDTIEGGADNGTGLGQDQLWGGDTNDDNGQELYDGYTVAGFNDIDFVSYENATSGVTVDLAIETVQNTGGGGNDMIRNFEGIYGSDHNDFLYGRNDRFIEIFKGGGGDDHIDGRGGFDAAGYRFAGNGISVNLADGEVTDIAGSSIGTDTLRGIEAIYGSAFDDIYDATGFSPFSKNAGGSGFYNSFRGGDGNDIITGNGNTQIDYKEATAGMTIDLGAGTIDGSAAGQGVDTLNGGINQAMGTAYDDVFYGGTEFNLAGQFEAFAGLAGNDEINGGAGFDKATYNADGTVEATISLLVEGDESPRWFGLHVKMADGIVIGDPVLTGTDTLLEVEGITGSVLDDFYDARGFGAGSTNAGSFGTYNEFDGHAGDDVIYGNGNTRVVYYSAQAAVTVDLEAGLAYGGPSVGTDTIMGGVNGVRGSVFGDNILGDAAANILDGMQGNDRIDGGAGNDKLTGGVGNDTFVYFESTPSFGADVITDFEEGAGAGDVIEFHGYFADFNAVKAAMTEIGGDVLISADTFGSILIKNATIAGFHADDFAFLGS